MTESTTQAASKGAATSAPRASISTMKLAELQALAASLGVKGTSKMRKSDLAAAITSTSGSGGSAPRAAKSAARESAPAAQTSAPAAQTSAPAAQTSARREVAAQGVATREVVARSGASESTAPSRDSEGTEPSRRPRRSSRTQGGAHSVDEIVLPTRGDADSEPTRSGDARSDADRAARAATAVADLPSAGGQSERGGRSGDSSSNDQRPRRQRSGRDGSRTQDGAQRETATRQQDSTRSAGNRSEGARAEGNRQDGGRRSDERQSTIELDDDRNGRRRRGRERFRDRDRDRDRIKRGRNVRGNQDVASLDEVELTEDDVLVPVAGILDILDNYAFVRTSGYLPGPNDVYLSLNQVKKSGLRRGDAVTGAIRAPRDGDNVGTSTRQKFNALVRLDTVNGLPADATRKRVDFAKLTPLYPQDRLRLESPSSSRLTPRVIDIVAPIGKGQRGLIVAPPKAGKTIIMQQIANAITTNNPEVHLMVVLVDERPEEVTDMERTVHGEVIASTFDRPASDHTIVAELAIERAKRLVEMGQDVVVLLDSLTRLSRAYNLAAPASGRILSGGVDASALYPPKRFFGAARNIEDGGSLTILASALVETGSKMDEVIFEEFKGTGNMELRLSRSLADKRIFPAVDINASGTRREEVLLPAEELKIIYKLRRVFGGLDQQQAIELLLGKLKDTKSNIEFLLQVQKTTPGTASDDNAGRTI